jgi:hypothetical protein
MNLIVLSKAEAIALHDILQNLRELGFQLTVVKAV